ncbi:Uncharacterised protein [Burkholderia pseudomallei]|nr:Uncharacterised protein [Burkholderia pseudomallei]VCP65544.1 Uncharacterised protein [Burkholderia pseudomallei]VCP69563.1 Uncharacterised protein [Burkholderia pseudomallei]
MRVCRVEAGERRNVSRTAVLGAARRRDSAGTGRMRPAAGGAAWRRGGEASRRVRATCARGEHGRNAARTQGVSRVWIAGSRPRRGLPAWIVRQIADMRRRLAPSTRAVDSNRRSESPIRTTDPNHRSEPPIRTTDPNHRSEPPTRTADSNRQLEPSTRTVNSNRQLEPSTRTVNSNRQLVWNRFSARPSACAATRARSPARNAAYRRSSSR